MKTVYCLEVKILNGTVTLKSEKSVFLSEKLAEKSKMEVEKANDGQSPFFVVCTIEPIPLFESEDEVPILKNLNN